MTYSFVSESHHFPSLPITNQTTFLETNAATPHRGKVSRRDRDRTHKTVAGIATAHKDQRTTTQPHTLLTSEMGFRAGIRLTWITNVSHGRAPVVKSGLRPPCPRRPIHRSTQCHSHHFSHSTHCRARLGAHSAHRVVVLRFLLAKTRLPRSPLLPSKKNGLLQSNVTCVLCSLPSAT